MLRTYIHAALGVLLATLVGDAHAIITALSPYGATVVNTGKQITAVWDVDPTGTWTSMTITLMTGYNSNMAPLLELGSGIDATLTTTYTFTAPDVTPNSAIYFLQFSQTGQYPQWTSRFTILDSNGDAATAPEHATQPEGDAIPWGLGQIVGQPLPTPTLNATSSSTSKLTDVAVISATVSGTASETASSTTSASASATTSASCSASSCATASPTVNSHTTTAAPCSASTQFTASCQYVTFTGSSGGIGLSMDCSSQTVAAAGSASLTITTSNDSIPSFLNGTSGTNSANRTQATSTKGLPGASSASQGPLATLFFVVSVAVVPVVFALI